MALRRALPTCPGSLSLGIPRVAPYLAGLAAASSGFPDQGGQEQAMPPGVCDLSVRLAGAWPETVVFGMCRHPSSNLSLVMAASLTLGALAGVAQAQSRPSGSPSAATSPATSTPAQPSLTPRASPQPAPSTAAPPPASAIGAPAPAVPSIAPLSPPQSPSTPSSGGLPRQSTLALTPGSRSEAAPSAAGGGGRTLNDCMEFWEPTTHMTKQEWRAACKRTLGRIQ